MTTPSADAAKDPYKANFQIWKVKTHTHLVKNGPPSHKTALSSLEAASEMITQNNAHLAGALKRSDKAAADKHSLQIAKLQGVHDGILAGLAKAGHLHPRAARRSAFKKDLITESQLFRAQRFSPKPVVGIWFGKGSAVDHSAYEQGVKAAEKVGDDFEIEHLKNSAVKAHEKHVQLALTHEDRLREIVNSSEEDQPKVQEERVKVQQHKDLADTFHAFARGLHRFQTGD